ncbi:inorganic phosphate transporter [Chondromyces apiculatus]|uniref:Phosphate transporter n=1 Tax=Chondromyces apiculatus DSM 436 TaxID=1192034 RepID=A0A017SW80_9BACT|nr:inorganic phosphate transporter [Chondromyces apiculatus]EYF01248.1 Low-affinity inorganic phosphate transporter [Chondromyces apiculatus DSM 436]
MEALFDPSLGATNQILVFVCLAIALGFEFVNGFHDTANAVATVIYTNALRAPVAVVLSGICNFIGVFVGGIAVAIGIIQLLPVELLVSKGVGAGLAMVLALLLSAITWNLGTWYFGLPASSSHTLIGAILGVGIANSLTPGHTFGDGVRWSKAGEIGLSLLVSPLMGFTLAALLMLLIKRFARDKAILARPPKDTPPPRGIRALLIATCCGVSFAHGSNDGQKGVGLVMLILIGLVPASFAVNVTAGPEQMTLAAEATRNVTTIVREHHDARSAGKVTEVLAELGRVSRILESSRTTADIPRDDRFRVRQQILLADRAIEDMVRKGDLGLTSDEQKQLTRQRKQMKSLTDYAPNWVLFVIALALGIGTMVGWKRIVVTVGEKIGKSHLTYAQGASAELVAATMIGFSSIIGLPVSTTHVLSSGVAGTMVAQRSGLQRSTVRNIGLAWVMTLPASMTLSAIFFLIFRALFGA